MPRETNDAPVSNSSSDRQHEMNGPNSIGDAWVHAINPIDLYKDARESANSWLPLGIGFAIDHPSELASPEFLELAVLDPVFRASRAVGDIASASVDSIQDGGSAFKSTIEAVKDVVFFGVDAVTLNWSDAGDDFENFFSDTYHAVKSTIDSTLVDPTLGVATAIGEFL